MRNFSAVVEVHLSRRAGSDSFETDIRWPARFARDEQALTDALADLVAMRLRSEGRSVRLPPEPREVE